MQFSDEYLFNSRSAIYGDGCFTTIAIEQGKPELLPQHLTRLRKACERLELSIAAFYWQQLEEKLTKIAIEQHSGIVKVIISAGNGGRGYQRNCDAEPQCYLQTLPPVAHYGQWQKNGISLGICHKKLAKQPELAGIKHLNRLEQVMIKQHKSDTEDNIVLDSDNIIVEVSAGNLFWRAFNRWFTADTGRAGVEGVMRNYILSKLGETAMPFNIVRAKLHALEQASDVFICNSLMKLVPVNLIYFDNNRVVEFENGGLSTITDLIASEIHF